MLLTVSCDCVKCDLQSFACRLNHHGKAEMKTASVSRSEKENPRVLYPTMSAKHFRYSCESGGEDNAIG